MASGRPVAAKHAWRRAAVKSHALSSIGATSSLDSLPELSVDHLDEQLRDFAQAAALSTGDQGGAQIELARSYEIVRDMKEHRKRLAVALAALVACHQRRAAATIQARCRERARERRRAQAAKEHEDELRAESATLIAAVWRGRAARRRLAAPKRPAFAEALLLPSCLAGRRKREACAFETPLLARMLLQFYGLQDLAAENSALRGQLRQEREARERAASPARRSSPVGREPSPPPPPRSPPRRRSSRSSRAPRSPPCRRPRSPGGTPQSRPGHGSPCPCAAPATAPAPVPTPGPPRPPRPPRAPQTAAASPKEAPTPTPQAPAPQAPAPPRSAPLSADEKVDGLRNAAHAAGLAMSTSELKAALREHGGDLHAALAALQLPACPSPRGSSSWAEDTGWVLQRSSPGALRGRTSLAALS